MAVYHEKVLGPSPANNSRRLTSSSTQRVVRQASNSRRLTSSSTQRVVRQASKSLQQRHMRPLLLLALWMMLFTAVTTLGAAQGIKVSRVLAPPWLEAGGSGVLECEWQLQGDSLYSVKWYHGIKEIYRYTPSKRQPLLVFPNEHLVVDGSRSSMGRVRLSNVSLQAAGLFRCEVSGDAPAFYTDYGAVKVRVIALPEGGPVIQGVLTKYQLDDWVNLTCTSPRAQPPPHLTFLINGEQAQLLYVEPQRTQPAGGSLQRTVLRMRFPLRQYLLREGGVAKVRCHAQIEDIYEAADEQLLRTNPHYQASVFGRFSNAGTHRGDLWVLLLSLLLLLAAGTCCSCRNFYVNSSTS